MSRPAALPVVRSDSARLLQVYAAEDLFVVSGVNRGDPAGPPEGLCPGDIYQLGPRARLRPLSLTGALPSARAAFGSSGGGTVTPAGQLNFMAPDGQKAQVLLLRVTSGQDAPPQLRVLPLGPLFPRREYILLEASRDIAAEELQLTGLLCLSLHRGTHVTGADLRPVAVEDLHVGDLLLTRDRGLQPLRWIGRRTLSARGSFAPVVVPAGVLGNSGDLVTGPEQRLFLYQRQRLPGQRLSELLVQARQLVDGDKIYVREGGYAEYFNLVFDRHEVIYAEGVPVESLMINEQTRAALPAPLRAEMDRQLPGLRQDPHIGEAAAPQQLEALQSRLHRAQGLSAASRSARA